MSKEYLVLIVEDPDKYDQYDVDGLPAEVFMRFTEEPKEEFLITVARAHPGKRVYCLMGASTWHSLGKNE